MEKKKEYLMPLITVYNTCGEDIIATSSELFDPNGIFGENGDKIFDR